ncbi:MAG: hypothetical protein ACP5RT_01515 [Candidatus Micrarchaeia archaeon]
MKIQTSLEFLLIISAISLLLFLTLGIYASRTSQDIKLLNLGMNDLRSNTTLDSFGQFNLSFFMPFNTVVGNSYTLDYVAICPNGLLKISLSSEDVSFSKDVVSGKIYNILTGYVYIIPKTAGENNVTISYNASCGKSYYGSLELSTYAYQNNQNQSQNQSASSFSIYNRKEFLVYNYSDSSNINNLNIWGHCTYYPPGVQNTSTTSECMNRNSWDFNDINYYCDNLNRGLQYTTCIAPTISQYNISYVYANQYSFLYSFSLIIYYKGMLLHSSFNSTNCTAVLYGNKIVGKACISSVSGVGSLGYLDIISGPSGQGAANMTLYQSYIEAKNNLYSTLSFFNSTYVNSGELAQINNAINYYEKASENLEKGGYEQIYGCIAKENYIMCKPAYPISYTIDVRLNIDTKNETIYDEGSILYIS